MEINASTIQDQGKTIGELSGRKQELESLVSVLESKLKTSQDLEAALREKNRIENQKFTNAINNAENQQNIGDVVSLKTELASLKSQNSLLISEQKNQQATLEARIQTQKLETDKLKTTITTLEEQLRTEVADYQLLVERIW